MKNKRELDIIKKEKMIICNIAWMRDYNGITHGDIPRYYEKTVNSLDWPGEIYNFQEFNGNCYGYMEQYGNMEIERYFSEFFDSRNKVKGFTIVWCSVDSENKTKIVGWYNNAILHRNHRYVVDFFPEATDENGYNAMASIDDCYLIPEEKRSFIIDEVLTMEELLKLKNTNIWYEDEKNRYKTLNKIKEYIESYDGDFSKEGNFNRFLETKAYLSGEDTYEELYKIGMQFLHIDSMEAIKYFNSARDIRQTSEVAFNTGVCLQNINCFDKAIEFYVESLGMHQGRIEVLFHILICYAKKGDAENTVELSKKIIKILKFGDDSQKEDMMVDIYFILSNTYIYMNKFKDARNTIKRILDIRQETEDKVLVQEVLEIIEEVEQDYFYRC